jgi:hypothetical protein
MADDPLRHPLEAISAALTLLYAGNRAVIEEAAGRLEGLVRASADQMSAASVQNVEGAKRQAAEFVNRTGEWSAEKLRTAAEEAACLVLEQTTKAIDRAERAAVYAQRAMMMTGALTILCVGVFVYLALWVFPR